MLNLSKHQNKTNKLLKKYFLFFLTFIIIFSTQSCNKLDASYTEQLAGKRFELLEDSFLFLWPEGNYDIDVPGKFTGYSGLPFTIDDYLKFPNSWGESENYIKRFGTGPYFKNHVLGVLPKGTTVRFVKIETEHGFLEKYLWVCVEIENGPFKGFVSRISLIDIYLSKPSPIISKWIKELDGDEKPQNEV